MARVKEFDESEVLEKALEIFWSKGYNGTSMQDLIDGLGISRSSLYDTYGDKKTLFLSVLRHYRERESAALIEQINTSANIYDTIKHILTYTISNCIEDKQKKGCFMVNTTIELAPHDDEIKGIVIANKKEVEQVFAKAIAKGQELGHINKRHEAKALSKFIFNTFTGLRVSAKGGTDKKTMQDVIDITLAAIR
jgi:TetR/AcrR family transcriptional regulator, transcriptional repressor for nem operon